MIKSTSIFVFIYFCPFLFSQEWNDCKWNEFSIVVNQINKDLDSLKNKGMEMNVVIKFFESHLESNPVDSIEFTYYFKGQFAQMKGMDELQISNENLALIIDYEDSLINITKPVDIKKYDINNILQEMKVENAPDIKCKQINSIQIFFIPGGHKSGYDGYEYWVRDGKVFKYVAYSNQEVAKRGVGTKTMIRPRMEIEMDYSLIKIQKGNEILGIESVIKDWNPITPTIMFENFEILDLR